MSLQVLSATDVDHIISTFEPKELKDLMVQVFRTISNPSTPPDFSPARTTISSNHHRTLFMPSRMSSMGTCIKVVSVPTSVSDTGGLPASTLVIDEETGGVKAIINARSLTALRNAAGSLVSTRLVGPPKPRMMVAFGAGKQIEAHLTLHIRSYPSIVGCAIINRSSNDRLKSLHELLQRQFPHVQFQCIGRNADNTAEEQIRNLVQAASIIICATPSSEPLFPSSWVRNETHIILIGSYTKQMREIDRELVLRACAANDLIDRRLLVDSRQACLSEAGELIDAEIQPTDVVEIGELLQAIDAGRKLRQREAETILGFSGEVTIFKSVGLGLQDVAIACAVVERAEVLEDRPGVTILAYDK